eukprot:m.151562 g.151562  ORF g.151562 m.151562 type:complete len:102 (+) comp17869_c0_seq5:503-808(+)
MSGHLLYPKTTDTMQTCCCTTGPRAQRIALMPEFWLPGDERLSLHRVPPQSVACAMGKYREAELAPPAPQGHPDVQVAQTALTAMQTTRRTTMTGDVTRDE